MKRYIRGIYMEIIIVLVFNTLGLAQQTITVVPGDDIVLTADSYNGDIQWQQSINGSTWQNIEGAITSPYTVTITVTPVYFRARITLPDCDPHYSEIIFVKDDAIRYWSDPATWGPDGKPEAGEDVMIPEGVHIVLDENTPSLGVLEIHGTLEFDEQDLSLTARHILLHHGTLQIGVPLSTYHHKALITLTGTDINGSMDGGDRGIVVMNGNLELHGQSPGVAWTQLNATAAANSTQLVLKENVEWKAGDEVVIAPTDYFQTNGPSMTQKITLTQVNGNQLTLQTGLNALRWGVLQYATETGISLSPNNRVIPPVADTETESTPTILDERAEVGNLSRNIVIQGLDDSNWNDLGIGAHIMIMAGGKAHVEGVELRRMGQAGKLGRYPMHWHMLSIQVPNRVSGNTSGQYFRNSSIAHSNNRGVVIHGTDSLLIQNNIIYDIKGHGIFTEDAVEQGNTFDHNLVLLVRDPSASLVLKRHETIAYDGRGSSGFWISNPRNYITRNAVADCGSSGFWLAFTTQAWGLSQGTLNNGQVINPSKLLFGEFSYNTAHSNRLEGIMGDFVESTAEGDVDPSKYESTIDGRTSPYPYTTRRRHTFYRSTLYKNGRHGVWHRAEWLSEVETVSADNCGLYFAGAGFEGLIVRCLVIGNSLNYLQNGINRPKLPFDQIGGTEFPTAFATYHHTFNIMDCVVMEFPLDPGNQSGAFSTRDLYLRPVEKGGVRNTNNKLINSHPGFKSVPTVDYIKYAGAQWDPLGYWGPAGNYVVYNEPFFTLNRQLTPIQGGSDSGGISSNGHFVGVSDFVLYGIGNNYPKNQRYQDEWSMHVERKSITGGMSTVGTWATPGPNGQNFLAYMRHAALAIDNDAIYEFTFPEEISKGLGYPTNFEATIHNLLDNTQTVIIGVSFSGALTSLVVYMDENPDDAYIYHPYQRVNSLQAVINSSGETYYQDTAKNMIYAKLRGGFFVPASGSKPTDDNNLYAEGYFTIRSN